MLMAIHTKPIVVGGGVFGEDGWPSNEHQRVDNPPAPSIMFLTMVYFSHLSSKNCRKFEGRCQSEIAGNILRFGEQNEKDWF